MEEILDKNRHKVEIKPQTAVAPEMSAMIMGVGGLPSPAQRGVFGH